MNSPLWNAAFYCWKNADKNCKTCLPADRTIFSILHFDSLKLAQRKHKIIAIDPPHKYLCGGLTSLKTLFYID